MEGSQREEKFGGFWVQGGQLTHCLMKNSSVEVGCMRRTSSWKVPDGEGEGEGIAGC